MSINLAIIGGGPAGLRAAEVAAAGGASVMLFDAKPSVGRKFLVAGRGGLNLTHAEPQERFVTRYTGSEPPGALGPLSSRNLTPSRYDNGRRNWGWKRSWRRVGVFIRVNSKRRRCCAAGCIGYGQPACIS